LYNARVRTLFRLFLFLAVAATSPIADITAQSGNAAAVVTRAATALGGRDRILALKTLTVEGYGQLAYQNGGGNITSSVDAPQKWIAVNDHVRVTDLEHWRSRVRQRQNNDFVFAGMAGMKGAVSTQAVDVDVAYNIGATGAATRAPAAAARARRVDMLAHPIAFVRMALDPKATVANRRTSGGLELVDVTSPFGDALTLAVHPTSSLPAWVSWSAECSCPPGSTRPSTSDRSSRASSTSIDTRSTPRSVTSQRPQPCARRQRPCQRRRR
jgi:hypothetical protein